MEGKDEKPDAKMAKKDKMKVPTILKVKDTQADPRFADIHDNLPDMPCLALLIGSVRTGKSNLLVNFFCNESFYKGMFDTVKIISNTLHTDNKGQLLDKYFDTEDHYEDYMIEAIKQETIEMKKVYEEDDAYEYIKVADEIAKAEKLQDL